MDLGPAEAFKYLILSQRICGAIILCFLGSCHSSVSYTIPMMSTCFLGDYMSYAFELVSDYINDEFAQQLKEHLKYVYPNIR